MYNCFLIAVFLLASLRGSQAQVARAVADDNDGTSPDDQDAVNLPSAGDILQPSSTMSASASTWEAEYHHLATMKVARPSRRMVYSDLLAFPKFNFLVGDTGVTETAAKLMMLARDTNEDYNVREDLMVIPVNSDRFLCRLPAAAALPTMSAAGFESSSVWDAYADRTLQSEKKEAAQKALSLLHGLEDTCLKYTQSHWHYEYCHKKKIIQYREFASRQSPSFGTSSEGTIASTRRIEYLLGVYDPSTRPKGFYGDVNEAAIAGAELIDADEDGRRYLRIWYGDGQLCEGKPRVVEVQFFCCNTEHIAGVDEASMCNYVLQVHTPRLCGGTSVGVTDKKRGAQGIRGSRPRDFRTGRPLVGLYTDNVILCEPIIPDIDTVEQESDKSAVLGGLIWTGRRTADLGKAGCSCRKGLSKFEAVLSQSCALNLLNCSGARVYDAQTSVNQSAKRHKSRREEATSSGPPTALPPEPPLKRDSMKVSLDAHLRTGHDAVASDEPIAQMHRPVQHKLEEDVQYDDDDNDLDPGGHDYGVAALLHGAAAAGALPWQYGDGQEIDIVDGALMDIIEGFLADPYDENGEQLYNDHVNPTELSDAPTTMVSTTDDEKKDDVPLSPEELEALKLEIAQDVIKAMDNEIYDVRLRLWEMLQTSENELSKDENLAESSQGNVESVNNRQDDFPTIQSERSQLLLKALQEAALTALRKRKET